MRSSAVFVGMALLVVPLSAQDASEVGVLPGDRVMIPIAEKERNPFGKQEQKTPVATAAVDAASEESRIREAIGAMSVVGRVKGERGWKVLLDNLILESGSTIPPVIDGQTETLRVAAIYDGAIEIEWVEAENAGEPRRMFVPVDLSPRIRTAVGPPQDETRKPRNPSSR